MLAPVDKPTYLLVGADKFLVAGVTEFETLVKEFKARGGVRSSQNVLGLFTYEGWLFLNDHRSEIEYLVKEYHDPDLVEYRATVRSTTSMLVGTGNDAGPAVDGFSLFTVKAGEVILDLENLPAQFVKVLGISYNDLHAVRTVEGWFINGVVTLRVMARPTAVFGPDGWDWQFTLHPFAKPNLKALPKPE